MPIYEYVCNQCGHQLEARQKFSDDPLTVCPNCHQDKLERVVSATSFALKGSGWYADGYGEGGSKKSASSEPSKDSSTTPSSPSSDSSTKKSEDKKTPSSDTKTSTDKSAKAS